MWFFLTHCLRGQKPLIGSKKSKKRNNTGNYLNLLSNPGDFQCCAFPSYLLNRTLWCSRTLRHSVLFSRTDYNALMSCILLHDTQNTYLSSCRRRVHLHHPVCSEIWVSGKSSTYYSTYITYLVGNVLIIGWLGPGFGSRWWHKTDVIELVVSYFNACRDQPYYLVWINILL